MTTKEEWLKIKNNPEKHRKITAQSRARNRRYRARHKNCPKYKYMKSVSQNRCRYGIEPEDLEKMYLIQDNKCCICLKECNGDKNMHIDHCHTTLVVRGLLCDTCNRGLGYFKDDPGILLAAVEYLLEDREKK